MMNSELCFRFQWSSDHDAGAFLLNSKIINNGPLGDLNRSGGERRVKEAQVSLEAERHPRVRDVQSINRSRNADDIAIQNLFAGCLDVLFGKIEMRARVQLCFG